MSVTEFQRHQIFQWYEEAMGPDRAPIMMDLLPPVGWGEVATKTDLIVLEGRLRGEIAELRGELKGDMAELRGDLAVLRGEMLGMRGEMARSLVTWLLVSQATLVGLVLAAVKLG